VDAVKTASFTIMTALDGIEGLSECIGRAIQEHLARSNLNLAWPQIDSLDRPILRFEAFIEDAGAVSTVASRSEKIASVCVFSSFQVEYELLYNSSALTPAV
jgi:hypothetical protein